MTDTSPEALDRVLALASDVTAAPMRRETYLPFREAAHPAFVTALIREVQRLREATTWRPMDTAPLDETRVLVRCRAEWLGYAPRMARVLVPQRRVVLRRTPRAEPHRMDATTEHGGDAMSMSADEERELALRIGRAVLADIASVGNAPTGVAAVVLRERAVGLRATGNPNTARMIDAIAGALEETP